MKRIFFAAFACLALLIPQNGLEAQITWSPSVPLFAGGDNTNFISQNGTFVLGINPGGVDTTVGTAVFLNAGGLVNANMLQATGGVTSTQNGVTFTGDFDNVQQPTFGNGEFTDPAAQGLVTPATWNHDHVPGTPTVTFSGLTPGDTYEIQVLVSDARTRNLNWVCAFTNGSDSLVAGVARLSNRDPADATTSLLGDYIIGTFVADASGIQTFEMNATRGANQPQDAFVIGQTIDIASNMPAGADRAGTVQINALQLRNVPATACVLADVDMNGLVDFNDIPPFVAVLLGNMFQCEADCDENGLVDFNDIPEFVAILLAP